MHFREPRNDNKTYWTNHVKEKMRYYGIGEGRVRRILKTPQRCEEGIAPETIAVMQKTQSKKPSELWVMYQKSGKMRKVISAWRYPGISPKGKPIEIPDDALEELKLFLTKNKD